MDKFRNKQGVINIRALHKHRFMVFHVLEILIFKGLEGLLQLNGIIKPIAFAHLKNGINEDNMRVDNVDFYN